MRRAFALLLCLVLAAPASAAVLRLKDGSSVRGTVVSTTAREVVIHTEAGDRAFPLDKIARIDYVEEEAPAAAPVATPPSTSLSYQDDSWQTFTVLLGLGVPINDIDYSGTGGGKGANGGVGPSVGLQYLADVGPSTALGGQLEYLRRSASDSPGGLPRSITDAQGDTLLFLADAKVYLRRKAAVRPYLLGGVGGHWTSTVIDAQPHAGFIWSDTRTDEPRRLADDSSWGPAATARVGVDFMVRDPGFMAVEAGWTGLGNVAFEPTVAGADVGLTGQRRFLSVITFAIRWGWRF